MKEIQHLDNNVVNTELDVEEVHNPQWDVDDSNLQFIKMGTPDSTYSSTIDSNTSNDEEDENEEEDDDSDSDDDDDEFCDDDDDDDDDDSDDNSSDDSCISDVYSEIAKDEAMINRNIVNNQKLCNRIKSPLKTENTFAGNEINTSKVIDGEDNDSDDEVDIWAPPTIELDDTTPEPEEGEVDSNKETLKQLRSILALDEEECLLENVLAPSSAAVPAENIPENNNADEISSRQDEAIGEAVLDTSDPHTGSGVDPDESNQICYDADIHQNNEQELNTNPFITVQSPEIQHLEEPSSNDSDDEDTKLPDTDLLLNSNVNNQVISASVVTPLPPDSNEIDDNLTSIVLAEEEAETDGNGGTNNEEDKGVKEAHNKSSETGRRMSSPDDADQHAEQLDNLGASCSTESKLVVKIGEEGIKSIDKDLTKDDMLSSSSMIGDLSVDQLSTCVINDEETRPSDESWRLAVLSGHTEDIPTMHSNIVRIFLSSTFSGEFPSIV